MLVTTNRCFNMRANAGAHVGSKQQMMRLEMRAQEAEKARDKAKRVAANIARRQAPRAAVAGRNAQKRTESHLAYYAAVEKPNLPNSARRRARPGLSASEVAARLEEVGVSSATARSAADNSGGAPPRAPRHRRAARRHALEWEHDQSRRRTLEWLRGRRKGDGLEESLARVALLHRWFGALDADGSGDISAIELETPLVETGVLSSAEEVQQMVDRYDKDGDGELGFAEFVAMVVGTKGDPDQKDGQGSAGGAEWLITFFDAMRDMQGPALRALPFGMLVSTYSRQQLIGFITRSDAESKKRAKAILVTLRQRLEEKYQGELLDLQPDFAKLEELDESAGYHEAQVSPYGAPVAVAPVPLAPATPAPERLPEPEPEPVGEAPPTFPSASMPLLMSPITTPRARTPSALSALPGRTDVRSLTGPRAKGRQMTASFLHVAPRVSTPRL